MTMVGFGLTYLTYGSLLDDQSREACQCAVHELRLYSLLKQAAVKTHIHRLQLSRDQACSRTAVLHVISTDATTA